MNTEERIPAQHFRVSVLEVEGLVWGCGRGVDGILVIRDIRDREVGQSGDADRRRMGGRCRDSVCLWSSDKFEWSLRPDIRSGDQIKWRGPRNLRFDVSVRKSQEYRNGSRNRISLVRHNWPSLSGREYRWGRKALPTTLPQRNYLLIIRLSLVAAFYWAGRTHLY